MTGVRPQGGSGVDIFGHWHDSSLVLKRDWRPDAADYHQDLGDYFLDTIC